MNIKMKNRLYFKRTWMLYLMMVLPMLFIIVFKYCAYPGLAIAFQDYKVAGGLRVVNGSGWRSLKRFLRTGIFYRLSGIPCF